MTVQVQVRYLESNVVVNALNWKGTHRYFANVSYAKCTDVSERTEWLDRENAKAFRTIRILGQTVAEVNALAAQVAELDPQLECGAVHAEGVPTQYDRFTIKTNNGPEGLALTFFDHTVLEMGAIWQKVPTPEDVAARELNDPDFTRWTFTPSATLIARCKRRKIDVTCFHIIEDFLEDAICEVQHNLHMHML